MESGSLRDPLAASASPSFDAALQDGANVIATARKPQQLQRFVDKYSSNRILPVALDVTNNNDVKKAIKTSHDKFGRIDIVVNNAEYANLAATEDIKIDDFRAQVDTKFLGVIYVTKAVLPILQPGGMKTDWSGLSMEIPAISEPYKPSVGAFADRLRKMWGNEVSIPEKVAKIVIDLTKVTNPPLRLLIGTDAVEYGRHAGRALEESDKTWHDVSISSI
ncbi:hypothetical protein CEP52_017002 [Fusarium oligoseptatum]|uniref:Uncharacterized protein n=1 Tax=Fusarium oligoseptatum TaxID=2604345 RepID=A0A428RXS3_9HYPO|nr:hypothetical protein CEP52_017002 [Fusarium oligoseptatum]